MLKFAEAVTRRDVLRLATGSAALAICRAVFAAVPSGEASVVAVRIWPAADYTRITIEHSEALNFTHQSVKDPARLVLDLEGVEFNSVLANLPDKISSSDPYIKLIRAGRNRPGVVRLVIELKGDVKPQVFTLKPFGEYRHRLVLDLYPSQPIDPLMALLEKPQAGDEKAAREERKTSDKSGSDIVRMITIVLDPGHGGEDPGAVGSGGSQEKDVTLSIARRLKTLIDGEKNMRTVLTRDADYFIPLHERVNKARRLQADLFVSVHADAFVKSTARGSSVFVLSEHGASSSAARWLARRENSADLVGGVNVAVRDPDLARTLLDLSQTATQNDSLKLGKAVLGELSGINALHKGRVEQAGFAVLKAPDIPSILVETAFISNPEEERRLNDEAYQDKMAQAILKGIKRYFARNPPLAKSRLT